jgi:TRAP-type C4-dicarboxylate transport system substrate-binding protein
MLSINNPTPPGNPMEAMLLRWAKDFEEKTGGRYEVEVVSGGALGDTMGAYDSLIGGVADIAFFQPPMIEKPFPLCEIPVLFWGPAPADIFTKVWYHDIYKKGYLDEELAEVKVLTLYWGPVGDVNTVNPVNTVAELEGLKVANAQGATCIELMDRLGAVSVLAGPPDIYLMLQKGIADAMFGAVPMILEFHLDEFIQYLLPIQTTHMSHVVGLNLDVYNSMPDDVKKIIDEMANDDEYGVSAAREGQAWYGDGLDYAFAHGCTYCEWSDEEMAKLHEVAGAIWEEEMVKLDGMGIPGREVCDIMYNGAVAMGADPAEIAFGYTPSE